MSSVRATLDGIAANLQEHPVAATLEYGTVLACVILAASTMVLLVASPSPERPLPWLFVIGLGAIVVVFWTVLVPCYERWFWED